MISIAARRSETGRVHHQRRSSGSSWSDWTTTAERSTTRDDAVDDLNTT
jgi:hypothetical protein